MELRLGKKKAAVAMAHKTLVVSYHLLLQGTFYDEASAERQRPEKEERERNRAVEALERLGYVVTLAPVV